MFPAGNNSISGFTQIILCFPCSISFKSSELPLHLRSRPHIDVISSLKSSGPSQDDTGTVTLDSDISFSKPATVPERRPPSPHDDSVIELDVASSEPSVSVMEIIQPSVARNNGARIRSSSSKLMRPPVAIAGPSGIRPKVKMNTHQRPYINQQQQHLQQLKRFMYFCEACKKKFSDPQKFQSHSVWHDREAPGQGSRPVKMICQVCSWSVSDINVSDAVTKHLFSNRHTINVARKMSA